MAFSWQSLSIFRTTLCHWPHCKDGHCASIVLVWCWCYGVYCISVYCRDSYWTDIVLVVYWHIVQQCSAGLVIGVILFRYCTSIVLAYCTDIVVVLHWHIVLKCVAGMVIEVILFWYCTRIVLAYCTGIVVVLHWHIVLRCIAGMVIGASNRESRSLQQPGPS